MRSIIDCLLAQNADTERLLRRIDQVADSGLTRELVRHLRDKLAAHARAAQASLYDELCDLDRTRSVALRALEQYEVIEGILDHLLQSPTDAEWLEVLDDVCGMLRALRELEEVVIFPLAHITLDEQNSARIAHAYLEVRASA